MVRLTRIYTRTGDRGRTRLVNNAEVSKTDARVEAFGGVDELNAQLGLCRLHTGAQDEIEGSLARIQNELFDLGADLATPDDPDMGWTPLRITPSQVERLEADIDALNANLAPLESFVLPAGNALSCQLHVARTVCRRAEREALRAQESGAALNDQALIYLNRLSDYLFVAARFANDQGRSDVLWQPGASR